MKSGNRDYQHKALTALNKTGKRLGTYSAGPGAKSSPNLEIEITSIRHSQFAKSFPNLKIKITSIWHQQLKKEVSAYALTLGGDRREPGAEYSRNLGIWITCIMHQQFQKKVSA